MSNHHDWQDITYLKYGNPRQIQAHNVLTDLNIMSILEKYNPILTGTIPIGIDIPSSDLDIICQVSDFENFRSLVNAYWSNLTSFTNALTQDAYVASFKHHGFEIEIFAQNIPTLQQNAYRHMIVEYRILNLANLKFKDEIIKLKLSGYKTEPAFGKLLNLYNPFEELLKLEKYNDEELISLIHQNGYK